MKVSPKIVQRLFLILIVVVAFYLRTIGINWDQNQHLHPDERFLTMVTERLAIPKSFSEYLDPTVSPMNPYNKDTGFYVYGMLPVTIVKIGALLTGNHTYDGIAIFGRFASALFDVGTLIFVYRFLLLLVERLKVSAYVALIGALMYALLVLPIQISHFYTVDNLMILCTTASIYYALLYYLRSRLRHVFIASCLFGCAMACKISAVYVLPLIGAFIIIPKERLSIKFVNKHFFTTSIVVVLFVLVFYVILRIADPHLFQSTNLLIPYLSQNFIENMKQLASLASDNAGYFPPAVQWRNLTPVTFALKNMLIFGVGIQMSILLIIGTYYLIRKGNLEWRIIVGWVIVFFLYQSTRYSPSMRYFLFIYPFIAVFSGVGFYQGAMWLAHKLQFRKVIIGCLFLVLLLIYPISFIHIYTVPHSRVIASYWMYENLPTNATVTMEHWDDGLPLRVPNVANKTFNVVELPVFAPDNPEKWTIIQDSLSKADYIVMSSNRGYGSIMAQREMYPLMSRWYRDLFDGNLPYVFEKELTSYPTLCVPTTSYCVEFDDQWSEEAFTVYDHPKVTIFKKVL